MGKSREGLRREDRLTPSLPAHDFADAGAGAGAEAPYGRSKMAAIPWPPPTHMVSSP